MIIKEYTPSADIEALEQLKQSHPELAPKIDKELRLRRAGEAAEKEAARMIARRLGDSHDNIVLHGLRLEVGGEIVQIDHLLVNRVFRFTILETKSFKQGLRLTAHGEFERKFNGAWSPISSPVTQADIQKDLLGRFLMESGLLPTRFGRTMKPDLSAYVMISPETDFVRPDGADTPRIVRFDTFLEKLNAEEVGLFKTVSLLMNAVSYEQLAAFGESLAAHHRPHVTDWASKYGVKALSSASASAGSISGNVCKACRSGDLEMAFGRTYYFRCACGANTSPKLPGKGRIRKQGKEFFFVPDEGQETLFHRNA